MGKIIWQCILSLALVGSFGVTFDVASYCREACLYGQGGNLCRCSSVHFAGKRIVTDNNGPPNQLRESKLREYLSDTRYLDNGDEDTDANFGEQLPENPEDRDTQRGSAGTYTQNYKDLNDKLSRDSRILELKDKIERLADRLKDLDFSDNRLESTRRRFVSAWRKYLLRNLANPTSLSQSRTTEWTPATINGEES